MKTRAERLIFEHTGLNIYQIAELPIDDYMMYLRDAYICALNKTEAGQKYLEKCWIMEQTKPDRSALRNRFGKTEKKEPAI